MCRRSNTTWTSLLYVHFQGSVLIRDISFNGTMQLRNICVWNKHVIRRISRNTTWIRRCANSTIFMPHFTYGIHVMRHGSLYTTYVVKPPPYSSEYWLFQPTRGTLTKSRVANTVLWLHWLSKQLKLYLWSWIGYSKLRILMRNFIVINIGPPLSMTHGGLPPLPPSTPPPEKLLKTLSHFQSDVFW